MNYFKNFHLFLIPLVFLTTKCQFSNFYPDPDDQGLSRFTSRGYNVASTYINERPYRNTGSYYPLLKKDSTGNSIDTLQFTWQLYPNDPLFMFPPYDNISFHLPVPETFNKNNLLAFNGQRFLNSVPVTLQDSSGKLLPARRHSILFQLQKRCYPIKSIFNYPGCLMAILVTQFLLKKEDSILK